MDKINGLTFKQMLRSASNNLNNEKARVDALNVFPVPDGDTGTNMSMTFTNGVNEALNNGSENLSVVCKSLSRGLLMGARGNSGVILSQIFRGFYQYVDTKEEKRLDVEGIFPYIGSIPNTSFVKDVVKLNSQGYIITNEKMETSVEGIYGAGDVIDKQLRQVVTACGDGAVAAQMAYHYINK